MSSTDPDGHRLPALSGQVVDEFTARIWPARRWWIGRRGWRILLAHVCSSWAVRDRDLWARARTLGDLGELTACWLEGRLEEQPGYYGPVDVDEADAPGLTDALTAANRAGFVTTSSQAGYDGPGADGSHWRQLAWVSGFASSEVAQRLAEAAAHGDGQVVVVVWRRGDWRLPVTWRDGQPMTEDGPISRRVIRQEIYPGISRSARRQVYAATQVTIVHQVLGDNSLWAWLRQTLRVQTPLVVPPITGSWPGAARPVPAGPDRPMRTGAGLTVHVPTQRGRGESA